MEALITQYFNAPAIPVVAGSPQYSIYEGEETIYASYLRATIAGVAATDAQIDAQIAFVEVRDDEQLLIDRWTPAQLRQWYNHMNSKHGAYPADTGDIPIIHVPDNLPWRGTAMFKGLGRLAADGVSMSKYKITVQWAAVVTIDLLMPTLVLDPTDKKQPLGRHLRLSTWTSQAFAGTGDNMHDDIFRGMNAIACHELHFSTAVGTIATVTVLRGKEIWMLRTPVSVINRDMHRAGMVAFTSRQAVLFNQNNDQSSLFPLGDKPNVQITLNWSVTPGGVYTALRVMEYNGHVET
jgi:hypothetical protein